MNEPARTSPAVLRGAKREEQADLDAPAYLRKRLRRAALVCNRFPGGIDFRGRTVLDVGCGFGALSLHAAHQGARKVVGVDPDPDSVSTARSLLESRHPELASQVSFVLGEVADVHAGPFDVVVSMATFEHVADPAATLKDLRRIVVPGAKVYLGIGPLYRAPRGDHGRTFAPFQKVFPWAHLLWPERWLLARRNRLAGGAAVTSVRELGLNRYRLSDYLRAFDASGLTLEWWMTNRTENRFAGSLLKAATRLPWVSDLFVVNLYAVLSEPHGG